jgi:glycosyltransferase involved in cell wall biosynthesis
MTQSAELPGLSVVICTMRQSPHLADAMLSVERQTYRNWEVILLESGVDSGVGEIPFPDEKLRRIRTKPESLCAARNRGAALARSPLVAFLDDDDRWLPEKAAAQVELMASRPDVGMCHTQCNFIDEQGCVVSPGRSEATNYEDMLAGAWAACVSSMVFRRDAIFAVGGGDPSYRGCGDMDLLFKIARRWPIHFFPEALAEYRIYAANTSRAYRFQQYSEARDILHAHRRHAVVADNSRWVRLANKGISDVDYHYANRERREIVGHLANRRYRRALGQLPTFAAFTFFRTFDAICKPRARTSTGDSDRSDVATADI